MSTPTLNGGLGRALREWLGLAPDRGLALDRAVRGHGRHDDKSEGHGHTHGVIDPTIATTTRGIWALKWSFVILGITSILQLVIVVLSGSVALLADTIHNMGDAVTAIPLWIAFILVRRKPSKTFTYGLGRVEDLAGVVIVLIILFSAVFAGYEAINRLINPQSITLVGWVAAAGVFGFLGNEAVAVFRIRVGREINSAALIADGYHARTDGFTSLAVVAGAAGVWLGFPLADPIVGLLITIAIFGIVWQSSKAVFTRMLDGVDPKVIEEIHHVAAHIPGLNAVLDARARWLGHRLVAEVDIAVDGKATLQASDAIATAFEEELKDHLPALLSARIRPRPTDETGKGAPSRHGHHHAPEPFIISSSIANGTLSIVDTPDGERFLLVVNKAIAGLQATVVILRGGNARETLELKPLPSNPGQLQSSVAPAEPHEFTAELEIKLADRSETLPFTMIEPDEH